MNRRGFVGGCVACGLAAAAGSVWAQSPWQRPARFSRPEITTDEGGLWALVEREETRLRRSPFVLRETELNKYVNDIACKLAGEHCSDIRVYVVNTPYFNASIAPNGMMQVWTGLLLRADNEAQLAAVIGHEIGHYMQRHLVERLRDLRSRAAFSQFLGILGLPGLVGQLAVLATAFAYSRDQERDADAVGLSLMADAGYDAAEASRIWENLLIERNARPGGEGNMPLFATHPPSEERKETLARLAKARPGGENHAALWRERMQPFRVQWLRDEVRRGQHEESIALFTRMLNSDERQSDVYCARGEVYRLRAGKDDAEAALADFQSSVNVGGEPPEAHRGMGYIYRARRQADEARAAFQRYLDSAAAAPDVAMIKSYMEGM
jgi:predicted Zn-dependent protease